MSTNELHGNESIDPRDARALTECMTVLPLGGGCYDVVSSSGNTYSVDVQEGRCTCPDAQHNLPVETADGRTRHTCKHVARATYADGLRPIPAWIDSTAVDSLIGEHTDGVPRVAATDGGVVETDFDENEEESADRPDNCQCWDADLELPCWPCYHAGWGSQNPAEPMSDESD